MDKATPFFCDIIEEKEKGALLREILFIDDEDYISEILGIVLSEMGYSSTAYSLHCFTA